ncbi:hypothetical protein ACHAWO_003343 [Cyclotella atomus]|uniref:Deacetylase sirtuin-type domain-containing protein n=1 Tax=Cyclotella atomus TaxID=382360 RepID=A0ABD3MT29_9STRA
MQHPAESSANIFRRQQSIHGGPVTCATIRFPPPEFADFSAAQNETTKKREYDRLKANARIVMSRSGWIESHPLCTSVPCVNDQSTGGTDVHKALAFGNSQDVAFEAVSGMIYPSSSATLSYSNEDNDKRQIHETLSSEISVIAYGGRRLSFLAGGCLWNRCNSDGVSTDEFIHIPIVKHGPTTDTSKCSPYLEVSDWIHSASLLDIYWNCSPGKQSNGDETNAFVLALGTVNNNCEIWGLRSASIQTERNTQRMALEATKLQCITCEVRCMTYSLSFHGWNDKALQSNDDLPSLVAASGTVFGEIVVWGVVNEAKHEGSLKRLVRRWLSRDCSQETATSRLHAAPSFRLKGHHGSVFSVKFGPSGEIASTSDDRTVRLWSLSSLSDGKTCNRPITAREILDLQSTHTYILVWTGWGHTARVWDVSFASCEKDKSTLIITSGEDGVARVWSPYVNEKEIRGPLRGHRGESVWTVDICEGITITGGNDGSVKLFDLERRLADGPKTCTVPLAESILDTDSKKPQESTDTQNSTKKKKRKKTKAKGQMIGMQFYKNNDERKLLVACRDGLLLSFDIARNTWTTLNSWSENLTTFTSGESVDVDPSLGTCVAIHPSGNRVIVGTSDGSLISSELSDNCNQAANHVRNMLFNIINNIPVKSISWMGINQLLVFHARGVIILQFRDNKPESIHVLRLETSGIPMTFAYDGDGHDLYIGDSRGHLACFNVDHSLSIPCNSSNSDLIGRPPDDILARAHAKEHITDVALNSYGGVFSVGNDGCITQCRKDISGKLHKVFTIPVANVTGLHNIWLAADGKLVVGGYYGNDFVLIDVASGYELVRIETGGRQRRQELLVSPHNLGAFLPTSYAMAICTGENSIELHSQGISERSSLCYSPSVGCTLHAETINQLCWIKCKDCCRCSFILSGSNDCTVKLSKYKNNHFVSIKELPPHESCVRGVCASSHPASESTLLVSCGGKLSIEFYLLSGKSCNNDDSIDVSFLCSYRTLGQSSIDHRMNAVNAIPLHKSASTSHLVVAADSDGDLHVVVVLETALPRGTTIGKVLKGNGRPILCLDIVTCIGLVLVVTGNTAGEIVIWDLSAYCDDCSDNDWNTDVCLDPLLTTDAHSSGVNDLSVTIRTTSESQSDLVCCSVGDDQSLTAQLLTLTCIDDKVHITRKQTGQTQRCGSPLKAVDVSHDKMPSFCLIYTAGHGEFMTLWRLDFQTFAIKYLTSSSLGIDGSCIDTIRTRDLCGFEQTLIAVGGEGIEVQSVNHSAIEAAQKLQDANYLLITAGAGFSADSGLSTYESAPAEYKEMCDPSQLLVNACHFQRFWLNFTRCYRQTKPHGGYDLIDRWCSGGLLKNLVRDIMSSWWIYTSNIDGHFRRFGSFPDVVCEIHGNADEYICSCRTGYSDGQARIGENWREWNEMALKLCRQSKERVSEDDLDLMLIGSQTDTLKCKECQLPLRPSVLMFNDTDETILKGIAIQRDRYQSWERHVEEAITYNKSKLVILELGCGVNVPAVRQESEEVLLDCTGIIESQTDDAKGSVCLIRINPKNAELNDLGRPCESISIQANAKNALEEIDFWLRNMLN